MADCAPRTIARAETIPRKLDEVSSLKARARTSPTIERFLRKAERTSIEQITDFSQYEVEVMRGQIRLADKTSPGLTYPKRSLSH